MMSVYSSTIPAPSRISIFVPSHAGSVMGPGIASTSRFSSIANRAVMSDPDRFAACTISVALHRPAMMRLRAGKLPSIAFVPGSYSEIIAPPFASISCAIVLLPRGYSEASSTPEPSTAIVGRFWSIQMRCAKLSIPYAIPDTRYIPMRTHGGKRLAHACLPYIVAFLLPTTPSKYGEDKIVLSPRIYNCWGGL